MVKEHRDYRRLPSNINVRVAHEPMDKETRDYLTAVAENFGEHGVFIATDRPLPVGTIVVIELNLESEDLNREPVRAKAVVRWRNRWRNPRGMGLLFIEFEGLGENNFLEWLTRLYELEEIEEGRH